MIKVGKLIVLLLIYTHSFNHVKIMDERDVMYILGNFHNDKIKTFLKILFLKKKLIQTIFF